MKFGKIILGLVGALILLAGGFAAGSFITQTRTTTVPAQQFIQPTFIPQEQFRPTTVPQGQVQPTAIPQQGQGMPGWGMMNPDYVPQEQQGWGMMHDWNNNNWNGMHGGMMNGHGYGWQGNPNWNSTPAVPNGSQSYPIPSSDISFNDNVQPIFAARCVACHGGTNGLSLDTYDNVMKGGINGAVVIPGDVYNSRLAYYVYSGYMPFRNTPLTSTEIQTILDWIALGAPNN